MLKLKVEIINFKSILNKTIEFNEGLTFLVGERGKGKTTILESIKWCLYSSNKNTLPFSLSEIEKKQKGITKVKITFTYSNNNLNKEKEKNNLNKEENNNLNKEEEEKNNIDSSNLNIDSSNLNNNIIIIERSKLPDIVYIKIDDKIYKDQEAQKLINEIFLDKKLFSCCCYLEQENLNYILSKECSFQNKTEIIKNIILEEDMNENKINEEIKEYKNKYSIKLKDYEDKKKNYEEYKEKYKDEINLDEEKEEEKEKKEIEKQINVLKNEIKELEKIIENIEIYLEEKQKTFLFESEEEYNEYFDQIEIGKKLEKIKKEDIFTLNEDIFKDEEKDFSLEEYRELKNKINRINENKKICKKLNIKYDKNIDNLYNLKIKEKIKYDNKKKKLIEKDKYLKELKEFLCIFKNEEDYSNIKEKIEEGKLKKLKCPECKKNLLLRDNILITSTNEENNLNKDNEKLFLDKYNVFLKYKNFLEENKDILSLVVEEEDDYDLIELKKLIYEDDSNLEELIEKLKKKEDFYSKKDKTKEYFNLIKNKKEEIKYKEEDKYENINKDFNDFKKNKYNLKKIKCFFKEKNIKSLDKTFYLNEKETKERELKEKEDNLIKIKNKDIIIKINETFLELQNKYKESRKEMKKTKNKLEQLEKLRTIVRREINLYISEKISDLNNILNTFLSKFFDDMYIEILFFKESKDDLYKPEFNLEITHKGYTQDFYSLSGGEKDSVSIAFTLALNCLTNSKILIFDESIKFLNESKRYDVLEALEEIVKNKIIIFVSHDTKDGNQIIL
jgi:exonuclease SbcC